MLRVTGIFDDTIDDVTVNKNLKTESVEEETNIFKARAEEVIKKKVSWMILCSQYVNSGEFLYTIHGAFDI